MKIYLAIFCSGDFTTNRDSKSSSWKSTFNILYVLQYMKEIIFLWNRVCKLKRKAHFKSTIDFEPWNVQTF